MQRNPLDKLPIIGSVNTSEYGTVPLLDIKWMSDSTWRELTESPENQAKLTKSREEGSI